MERRGAEKAEKAEKGGGGERAEERESTVYTKDISEK
jgi:hypothetical protein